uniref:Uncharacterized protein n=1 Tax=Tanacetum cinerariifolium TaxID=118510 RepID=A0A6L2NLI3_TANCI|nr:hypothetical protein [Tanacetum cinerariifolium]
MEAPPSIVDGHHRETHQRTRIDLCYPGRMYVSGRIDIFDMVDINLFIVVALNMMVLKLGYTGESELMFYNHLRPLTSLDVTLHALACEEDVHCLATLVRCFKLIKVYIEHGVTVLDSYLRAPRFRETLEDITDEPVGSIIANRTKKMLLLTWHESSETTKEPDCILTPPMDESVITYTQLSGAHGVDTQSHVLSIIQSQFSDINMSFVSQQATASQVIDDVMRQLLFDETKLDGEACFVDVAGSGVDKVSTEAPIVEEVGTQEFSVEDVVIEDYVSFGKDGEYAEHDNGQEDESAPTDGQFFYDDKGINTAYETEYDVQSREDAGTDDDVDEDFLVDEENEIVEPDIDRRWLAELRTEMEGVINASGQWKYLFYTVQKFTNPKEAKDRVYLHSIKRKRNLKLYKNDSVRIRARCEGKVPVFTMSQGTGPTGPYGEIETGPSGSSGPTTRSKKRKNTGRAKSDLLLNNICEVFNGKIVRGRAKSDLLLNNICEVFNGKIVRGRDKPVITLLEYIREYCMERIVNVQGVIDKCTGPLTRTVTRIMESIKKEAHLMKEIGIDRDSLNLGKSLLLVEYMEGNILSQDTTNLWDQLLGEVHMSNNTFATQASCPGGNNAEGSGSASRQAQQTELAVGQDGLGRSGAGAVIGLSAAAGECGAGDPGAISDNGKFPMVDEEEVTSNKLAPMAEEMIMLIEGLGGSDLKDYVSVFGETDDEDSDSELVIPTPWSDESKNKKRAKRWREEFEWKRSLFEIDFTFGINAFDLDKGTDWKKRMDANVPDEIDGAKGEQVPNHVVKKGNLEFLVCKEVANPGVNKLVDKRRSLKRKRVYAE